MSGLTSYERRFLKENHAHSSFTRNSHSKHWVYHPNKDGWIHSLPTDPCSKGTAHPEIIFCLLALGVLILYALAIGGCFGDLGMLP
jgi:hypothetical protein